MADGGRARRANGSQSVYAGAPNPYDSEAYSAVSHILDHPLMARGMYEEQEPLDDASFSDALAQVNSDMTGLCRRMKMRTSRNEPEEVANRPASWHVDPQRGVVLGHASSMSADQGGRDRNSHIVSNSPYSNGGMSSRSNKRTPRYSEMSNKLPPLREGTYENDLFAPSKRGKRANESDWKTENTRRPSFGNAKSNGLFHDHEAAIWDDQPAVRQNHAIPPPMQDQPFEDKSQGAGKIIQHGMWVSSRIDKLMNDVESMKNQLRPRLDRNSLLTDLRRQVESLEQRAGLPPRSAAVSNPAPTSRLPPINRDDSDSIKSADAAIPGPKASESPKQRKGNFLSRKEFERRDQEQARQQGNRASREAKGGGNRPQNSQVTPRPPAKGNNRQEDGKKQAGTRVGRKSTEVDGGRAPAGPGRQVGKSRNQV